VIATEHCSLSLLLLQVFGSTNISLNQLSALYPVKSTVMAKKSLPDVPTNHHCHNNTSLLCYFQSQFKSFSLDSSNSHQLQNNQKGKKR